MYISLNWIKDFVDLDGIDIINLIKNRFTLAVAEIEGIEDGDVVAPQDVCREERLLKGADFGRALQGGDDHPVEREDEQQGDDKQEEVGENQGEDVVDSGDSLFGLCGLSFAFDDKCQSSRVGD